jgi:cytochrome c-type biogenesis protein
MTYAGSRVGAIGEARRIAFAFFAGIVISLVVLGTLASYFGRLLARWSGTFAIAAAVFSIGAGVIAIAGPALRRRVSNVDVTKRGGALGAFVYGLLYTVATLTTSAGPLLLLLTIAAAIGEPLYGAILSFGYGIGRGLPFLVLAYFAGGAAAWLTKMDRWRRGAEVVSGIALIGVGGYFLRLGAQLL